VLGACFADALLPVSLKQHEQQHYLSQQQQQQQQQQQLTMGDWPADWPRQGLFQAEYPKGFKFVDRWYQLGDRWYRFHDDGFQVRAGFREHAVYTYAYRDLLKVEVRQLQQQRLDKIIDGSSSSSQMSEQEVWVEVQQNNTVLVSSSSTGAPLSDRSGSKMLVLKGVESWGSTNTIAEFLQMQLEMHSSRNPHGTVLAATLV
jgi:hypothetical protein